MSFTHEEIIQVELALEKQVKALEEVVEEIAEENREAAIHILRVNRNALEKAKDLNTKYKRQLDGE